MTVQSQTNSISYSGNGVTTSFAYNFVTFDQTWLDVYVNGVLQTLTSAYSVTGVDNPSGGNIVFVTAPANGTTIYIARTDVPATQLVDYTANDPFPAETQEQALDKLTMLVQQQSAQTNKAIRLNSGDTTNTSTELSLAPKNDRLVMFNETTGNVQVTDRLYSFIIDSIDLFNNYIATGTPLVFPLDLGFITDPVITFTYDLGGLS